MGKGWERSLGVILQLTLEGKSELNRDVAGRGSSLCIRVEVGKRVGSSENRR